MLTVNEIFHSIQGSQATPGLPCVFVRLNGGAISDAPGATPPMRLGGRKREVGDVLAEVASYGCRLVSDGGEPRCRPTSIRSCQGLLAPATRCSSRPEVTCRSERVPARVVRNHGVKVPGRGEAGTDRLEQPVAPRSARRVKFRDRRTGRLRVRERRRRAPRPHAALGQRPLLAGHGRMFPAGTGGVGCSADRLPVRVQLQVHKVIWGPATRGVCANTRERGLWLLGHRTGLAPWSAQRRPRFGDRRSDRG